VPAALVAQELRSHRVDQAATAFLKINKQCWVEVGKWASKPLNLPEEQKLHTLTRQQI
jgi:hypothetical protein